MVLLNPGAPLHPNIEKEIKVINIFDIVLGLSDKSPINSTPQTLINADWDLEFVQIFLFRVPRRFFKSHPPVIYQKFLRKF